MSSKRKIFLGLIFLGLLFYPCLLLAETWVVSSYPLYKIFSEIFAEKKLYLIQPPKGEFHFYEPLPKDWEMIKKAELVAILGTEPFAKKVYQLVPENKLFSLKDKDEEVPDPHLWFDLKRLREKLEELMEKRTIKKDPHYLKWKERLQKFLKELTEIESAYASLSQCSKKELYVLGHRVFYYLLKDTGISENSLVVGHHHGEITPKRLRAFLLEAQKKKIKGVLLTEWEYLKYSQILEKEGFKIYKVPTGDQNYEGDFLYLLKFNLKIFQEVLNCEKGEK